MSASFRPKEIYAYSLFAKGPESRTCFHSNGACLASSMAEARGIALETAEKICPKSEGWSEHQSSVVQVPRSWTVLVASQDEAILRAAERVPSTPI